MAANLLTLGTSAIRQHGDLFSLNDLHRAAGGEAKHEPNQFTRLDQTRALIEEIKSADSRICIKTQRGAHGGTYASRELVIAYAAWISPAFHLKVIRVFLDAATPAQQALPYSIQPDQTLSAEQADALRNALSAHASKMPPNEQGRFLREGWSKLKAHFKTDYRHIPANQFTDAMSIVARHCEGHSVLPTDAKALNEVAEHFIQVALHIKAAANRIAAANGGMGSGLWVNPPIQFLR